MREVPLMKATQMLERETNVKKITEKLHKIGATVNFANKATRKAIEAKAIKEQLKTTKPVDGGSLVDDYITKETGKATFKVK